MLPKTVLGVDISGERIELALLKETREGVKLLKSASEPVPEGAISQGNVKDPVLLAKAIKALRSRCKIGPRRTVVSLFAQPVFAQIMELPENLPANIGQYVQKEVKHCAVLPRKNISLDYCGVSSSPKSTGKRVFVVAVENERMFALLRALNDAGLNVEAIEPAELACARAIYGKKIVNSFDFNVLIALIENSEVILSVFRNQTLDFVRTRDIGEDICQSEQGLERFAEEIGAIIQYYDMEIGDRVQSWRLITVLRQDGQRADGIGDFLRGKFKSSEVEVVSSANISENTPVVTCASPRDSSRRAMESDTSRASVVAAGLAMRLLDVPQPKVKINLLPPESAEVKAVKQHVLITANIIAVILAVMILTVGVLSAALNKKSETIAQLKEDQSQLDTRALLFEQKRVNEQAEGLREKLEKLNGILRSGQVGDWNLILDDIRQATPRSLWITSLTSGRQSKVFIKGRSVSYEAVRLFVDMLGKSEYIASADLVGAEKDPAPAAGAGAGGLISYSIDCSLAPLGVPKRATFEGT